MGLVRSSKLVFKKIYQRHRLLVESHKGHWIPRDSLWYLDTFRDSFWDSSSYLQRRLEFNWPLHAAMMTISEVCWRKREKERKRGRERERERKQLIDGWVPKIYLNGGNWTEGRINNWLYNAISIIFIMLRKYVL